MSQFPTRREFLQIGAAGIAAGGLAIVGDGTIFEANRPILISLEVHLPRLSDAFNGFRIAQLSDFHYDDYFSVVPLKKAIDIVNGLQADVAVLTGDFVTSLNGARRHAAALRAARAVQPCAQLLSGLRTTSGSLAVLGNHDVDTDAAHIITILESHNIPVLRNRSVAFERDGKRLWFAGVDDVLTGHPRLDLALEQIPKDEPVVLLAHEPDWADYVANYPVDLQLAGHSHGGQIRLPLLGAPYLPPMARKYPCGFRRIGRLALYTNAGIGTIAIPMRLDCPPEVTLITLRSSPVVEGVLKMPS